MMDSNKKDRQPPGSIPANTLYNIIQFEIYLWPVRYDNSRDTDSIYDTNIHYAKLLNTNTVS